MHTATAAHPVALAPAFTPAAAPLSWADVLPYRGDLLRYARRKLMDPSLAEDLVHDVFEAVATGRAAFGGRSALRTWLVGILKHKIVDLVRERAAHEPLADTNDDGFPSTAGLVSEQPGPDEQVACRQRLAVPFAGCRYQFAGGDPLQAQQCIVCRNQHS